MIRNQLTISPFKFETGERLDRVEIVYHTSKPHYTPGDLTVWICHALTADSDVEDWWATLTGPGKLIDTGQYFVVCVNMLCSSYGSSGPASLNPLSGRPYFFDFPRVTIRDMAAANIAVRKHLGIREVDLLIGSSIGGFQALELAVTEPEVYRRALFMATAPRVSPWLSAGVEAQRMAIEADQTFRAAKSLAGGAEGLKCARAQALISYRCFKGFALTQAEADPDTLFAAKAASYERYQGEKLIRRHFDAYSYWYLCHALDSHNTGRRRGGMAQALQRIRADSTVSAIDTDGLFPPEEMRSWAGAIPGAKVKVISSSFGHDGFLLETEQLTEIIQPLLCKY